MHALHVNRHETKYTQNIFLADFFHWFRHVSRYVSTAASGDSEMSRFTHILVIRILYSAFTAKNVSTIISALHIRGKSRITKHYAHERQPARHVALGLDLRLISFSFRFISAAFDITPPIMFKRDFKMSRCTCRKNFCCCSKTLAAAADLM